MPADKESKLRYRESRHLLAARLRRDRHLARIWCALVRRMMGTMRGNA